MRRAFTLIELLVVIAIIAILAAILFPVFAQAKIAAKQSASLSNMKQIGLAQFMYMNDNEDRYPTSYLKRFMGDFNWWAQPYMKNLDILISPGRNIAPTSLNSACANDGHGNSWDFTPYSDNNPTNMPKLWGYGFNIGYNFDNNTGLVRTASSSTPPVANGNQTDIIVVNGHNITVTYRPYPKVGINSSEVAAPASVLMEGETAGLTLLNISMDDLRPINFPGVTDTACEQIHRAGSPFYSGGYAFLYCDGHVKFQKLNKGLNTGGYAALGGGTDPLVIPNPCQWLSNYDGGNNPNNCQGGFAGY